MVIYQITDKLGKAAILLRGGIVALAFMGVSNLFADTVETKSGWVYTVNTTTTWQGNTVASEADWTNSANWSDGAPFESWQQGEWGSGIPSNPESFSRGHNSLAILTNVDLTFASGVTQMGATLDIGDGVTAGQSARVYLDGGTLSFKGVYVVPAIRVAALDDGSSEALLHISNGGQISASFISGNGPGSDSPNFRIGISVGDGAGTTGKLIVESDISGLGTVSVGRNGNAMAEFKNGAKVSATGLNIGGNESGGTNTGSGQVWVTGEGTNLELLGSLLMGADEASGSLNIENGAKVSVNTIRTGLFKATDDPNGGTATIRVSGDGSELNQRKTGATATAFLGQSGNATLIVSEGGKFTANADKVVLGVQKGMINYGDYYFYNSKGVIQIGEGSRAGTIEAAEITSGYGGGLGEYGNDTGPNQIIFNHNESNYVFSTRVTATDASTLPSGSRGGGVDVDAVGSIQITVLGGGRTTLTGANTYTGGTIISNGMVIAAIETALGSGSVEVQAQGGLQVAPEIGMLHLGATSFEGGSTLGFTVSLNSADSIRFSITGSLDLLATELNPLVLSLSLPAGFNSASDYEWTFLTASEGITGFDAKAFAVNLDGWLVLQEGNSLALSYSAVPEPSTWALFVTGALSFLILHRHRRPAVTHP